MAISLRSLCLFAVVAAIGMAPLRTHAQGASVPRTLYVSVLDNKRAPVAGLTAADFTVREAGKTREVVRAEVATDPLHVAIVVDDDDQGGQAIRAGLSAFITRLAGRGMIALASTRGGPVVRSEFSGNTATLSAIAASWPLVNPGLAYLPNALLDFSRAMTERHAVRPVIVAIASPGMTVSATEDGPDGSVPTTRTIGAVVSPSSPGLPLVVDALRRSHTTFYMLHLDTYTARGVDNQPPVVQYSWPVDAPSQTGGRTDRLVTAQGLQASLERIADELLGQYAVTYASADGVSNVPVSVDTKRKGATVRAPQRVY